MKLVIGNDHAGLVLKRKVLQHLQEHGPLKALGLEVTDVGCHDTASIDYPDYAKSLCQKVQEDLQHSVGIAICGSGVGISIVCAKQQDINAGLAFDLTTLQDEINPFCNVMALGERVLAEPLALRLVTSFLLAKHAQMQ